MKFKEIAVIEHFKYKYLHVWISVSVFIACLPFPGFYTLYQGKVDQRQK
jgi:hypothetical protein